jgi:hypothetical protein
MTGIFERLRHSQFAEPIWQPVIFALLLLLISITLVLNHHDIKGATFILASHLARQRKTSTRRLLELSRA